MSENLSLQNFIFKKVLAQFKKKSEAAESLAQILQASTDSVYKRLRGFSNLSIEELEVIAAHYTISIDEFILNKNDAVIFRFNSFHTNIKSFEDYLEDIEVDIKRLDRLPDLKIYYASTEIPLFYSLNAPELLSFKLFVWARSVWNFEHLQNRKFSFGLIPPDVLNQAQRIWDIYRTHDSVEMWSLNIFDSLLNQIEYYVQTNAFAQPRDALLLCESLIKLAQNLEHMAVRGKKQTGYFDTDEPSGDFVLYHNEIINSNNTIFVDSSVHKSVYTTYGNPNFLKSEDMKLIDYTQKWLDNVISKSTQMSLHGEKGRRYFFDTLYAKIKLVAQRIEMKLGIVAA